MLTPYKTLTRVTIWEGYGVSGGVSTLGHGQGEGPDEYKFPPRGDAGDVGRGRSGMRGPRKSLIFGVLERSPPGTPYPSPTIVPWPITRFSDEKRYICIS